MKLFKILIIKKLGNSLKLIETEPLSVKYRSIGGTILISVIYHKRTASCLSYQRTFRGIILHFWQHTQSHSSIDLAV